jgi:integrase
MAGIRRHPGVAPVTRRAAARRDDIAYDRRPRDRGLTRNSIRLIITRRATVAGLATDDGPGWGAHSLRRGFATEAIARGVPERDV